MTMVRMPWMTYLWPGLPQLWRAGIWWGLVLAVGFGILLNTLLMASLVWVEWLSPGWLRWAWLGLALIWAGSAVASAWHSWGVVPRVAVSAEAMFRAALGEYLKGNWFEAERTLGNLLQLRPADVEARLLLATLLRHSRRFAEASQQLQKLELLEDARRWKREIQFERQAVATGSAHDAEKNHDAGRQTDGIADPQDQQAA